MSKPTATSADQERRVIRDAKERLLDGQPIRPGGKLTVKSLVEEAGVKRWLLPHKHTDLHVKLNRLDGSAV